MTRSKWKYPYFSLSILKKKKLKIQSRSSTILPRFKHKLIKVYNGKIYKNIYIKENMIGKKFGEFVPTRILHVFKKKKKKKK